MNFEELMFSDEIAEECQKLDDIKFKFSRFKNTLKTISDTNDNSRIGSFNGTIMDSFEKIFKNAVFDMEKKDFYNAGGWISAGVDLHKQCISNFNKINDTAFNSKPGDIIISNIATLIQWHRYFIYQVEKYIPNAKDDIKKLDKYIAEERTKASDYFYKKQSENKDATDDVKSQLFAKNTNIALINILMQALLGVLLIFKSEMKNPGKTTNCIKPKKISKAYSLESSASIAFIDGYFAALESVSADVKNAVNDHIKEIYKLVNESKKYKHHSAFDEAIKCLESAKKLANICDKKLSAIKDDDSTIQNIISHLNPRYLFDTKGTYVKTGEKRTITSYQASSYNSNDHTYGNTTKTERTVDEKAYIDSRLNKKNMNIKNAQLHRAHAIIQNAIVYCNEEIKNLKEMKIKDAKYRK